MYKLPLAKRINRAEWKRNRYRSDPAFRLTEINRSRVAQGFAPLASLDDGKLMLPREGAN